VHLHELPRRVIQRQAVVSHERQVRHRRRDHPPAHELQRELAGRRGRRCRGRGDGGHLERTVAGPGPAGRL
jgi:hypothetical protein